MAEDADPTLASGGRTTFYADGDGMVVFHKRMDARGDPQPVESRIKVVETNFSKNP